VEENRKKRQEEEFNQLLEQKRMRKEQNLRHKDFYLEEIN